MPNQVLFVTLYEGGQRVRLNLSSSSLSAALGDGWYQVSIPLSGLSGRTTATGIVFESDNTAPMQFAFLLNDIGFSEADEGDGGDGGDGGNGGGGDIVLATFDEATPPAFEGFEGATAAIEVGPAGGDGSNALQIVRDGGKVFAGVVLTGFEVPSDVATQTVSALVYSPTADIRFVVKTEYVGADGNVGTPDADANEAVIAGWQTLTWTITNLDPAQTYTRFVILPDLDVIGTGETYYVDNITLVDAGGGDTGGGDTVLATFDEVTPPAFEGFEGATAAIEVGPAGGDGSNALQIVRDGGANFAGVVLTGFEVPSDVATQTISALVYSPTADIRFVVKTEYVEGDVNVGTPDADANEAIIAGWQTLTWTITNLDPAKTYTRFVILPDLGEIGTGETYYVDNITLVDAGGGDTGGGGSGAEGELAVNGDFETGEFCSGGPCDDADTYGTGWQTFPQTGANNIVSPGNGSTYAGNSTLPGGPADNLIKQANLLAGVITTDDQVTINFDARGSFTGAGGVVQAIFFSEFTAGGAEPQFFDIVLNADPDVWTSYTWTVSPIGADVGGGITLALKIACGGDPCTADVYWDNVSIVIN